MSKPKYIMQLINGTFKEYDNEKLKEFAKLRGLSQYEIKLIKDYINFERK